MQDRDTSLRPLLTFIIFVYLAETSEERTFCPSFPLVERTIFL